MKVSRHFIVSFFVGVAVWFFVRSLYAGLICFFSGVVLDLDHIIDYIVRHGWKGFTYKKLLLTCEQTPKQEGVYQLKKIYIIFHSIEIAILLWFLTLYTRNVYLFAITLGYSTHLILDNIGNPVYPYTYFIIFRARNKFLCSKLFRKIKQG